MRQAPDHAPAAGHEEGVEPGTWRRTYAGCSWWTTTRSVCGNERSNEKERTPGNGATARETVVAVDLQEADPDRGRERRSDLRPQDRRPAANLDGLHGKDRSLARHEVGAARRTRSARARPGPSGPTARCRPSSGTPRRAGSTAERAVDLFRGSHGRSLRRRSSFPYTGGSSSGPRNCTSCRSSTPNRSCTRRRASTINARQSALVAPTAFSMKFAWRGEISAPPIRWPLRPHSSISRPAPRSPSGFLKTLPKVRLFVGWEAFRWASSSAARALTALVELGSEPEPDLRHDLA